MHADGRADRQRLVRVGVPADSAWPTRSRTRRASTPGAKLPVCLVLHGFAANETDALERRPLPGLPGGGGGRGYAPFALASVAGGNGYWHPHPDDDPLGMLIDEFLPLLGAHGLLGRAARRCSATRWAGTARCCAA